MLSATPSTIVPLTPIPLAVPATRPLHLLIELERRQDEVLAQLEDLDLRIERLLEACGKQRPDPAVPETAHLEV